MRVFGCGVQVPGVIATRPAASPPRESDSSFTRNQRAVESPTGSLGTRSIEKGSEPLNPYCLDAR